jgi:hypothetical protein
MKAHRLHFRWAEVHKVGLAGFVGIAQNCSKFMDISTVLLGLMQFGKKTRVIEDHGTSETYPDLLKSR